MNSLDACIELFISLLTVGLVLVVVLLTFAAHLMIWLVCLPFDLLMVCWRRCCG